MCCTWPPSRNHIFQVPPSRDNPPFRLKVGCAAKLGTGSLLRDQIDPRKLWIHDCNSPQHNLVYPSLIYFKGKWDTNISNILDQSLPSNSSKRPKIFSLNGPTVVNLPSNISPEQWWLEDGLFLLKWSLFRWHLNFQQEASGISHPKRYINPLFIGPFWLIFGGGGWGFGCLKFRS